MSHPRAGTPAQPQDLIDPTALIDAYYNHRPDVSVAEQRVSFGTSGHRGSSLNRSFNEQHIWAITQAICDFRHQAGISGPLLIGHDPHALSGPALQSAIEVLIANDVAVWVDSADRFVPTPAVSRAIVALNHLDLGQVDGIIVTPSHNPPKDGGFKYNPPHGGPADSTVTAVIANRANELLAADLTGVRRIPFAQARAQCTAYDFLGEYVADLPNVVNVEAIRQSGVRVGADPMGGASVDYWAAIAEQHQLDLTVVNPQVDPRWPFMTLDWDGQIRMDCSSPSAMAALIEQRERFSVATGNDADADRHGIVTPDAGLMNPNHFLAVAIQYLCTHRPGWSPDAAVGKTMVSSSMIDRVVSELGRPLYEVPVGFKWFVPGLSDGSVVFGGEESAGASYLRNDGTTWTTDKDGISLALLAAEIIATTGRSPSEHYAELTERHGAPAYARVDAPASRSDKERLAKLSVRDITATTLAGEPIAKVLTGAPGNSAAMGGVKVRSANAWFAARPSGTEEVYKIYAESFLGPEHLAHVQLSAKQLVDQALAAG